MPESAVTFTDSGNPNNWLSSLSIEGYSLTPSFQGAVTEYTLIVGDTVSSVTVDAKAVAAKSGVSGTGAYTLNYGNNTVTITCMSQSGSARTYTLNIVRQQPQQTDNTQTPEEQPAASEEEPAVSIPYPVDTYLTGAEPGTNAADVVSKITAKGCTVKVLKADGTENTGIVATGDKVTVYAKEKVIKEYEVVIYGDINGDGKISVVDLVLLQKHLIGSSPLSGAALAAADTSKDGAVTIKDLVILQKHIVGVSKISQ